MFICTDCAHNLQKTCDFLNKCRKTCKVLKGYVRKLTDDDSSTKGLVDLTVTLSDFRKQVFTLKPCDNTNSSADCNTKCVEKLDNSELKTLFQTEPAIEETCTEIKIELESDVNCDFIHVINPLDIKVELPDDITADLLNASVNIKQEMLEYNFQDEPMVDQVPSKIEEQLTTEAEEKNKVKLKNARMNLKKNTYSCCLCCLRFKDRNMLISHLLIHKQSRKISQKNFYQCTLCNRSYRLKDAFITHYLFHNGYRPYKCSACEKIFKQRSDLALHMKSNCLDMVERPHKCTVCEKAFKREAHLNEHKLIHNTLRKFNMCDRCNGQFLSKKLLNRHMLYECKEENKVVKNE